MKILHCTASYKPSVVYGGPIFSVAKMCEVLTEAGEQVEVFTTTANGKVELPVKDGAQMVVDGVPVTYFVRITKDHTHLSPALLRSLRQKLKGISKPDVVHIHAWWNLVSVFSAIIAVWEKQTVVLSPRGTLSAYSFQHRNEFLKNIIYKFTKKTVNSCHIHATSEHEKLHILSIYQPKSITVIPNFVVLPEYNEPISGINSNKLKLLFLSRIDEKKGLDILFDALEQVKFPYQLTIAGAGTETYIRSLKDKAEYLGVAHNLQWIGPQNAPAKFSIMQHHDLFILPSRDENFANVVIESLAMGTPVLLTENVGLADYVAENKFGWISSLNPKDMAEMLNLIAESRLVLNRIRERAPQQVRADFDDKNLLKQYLAYYQALLPGSRP